jgi:hypothetical protein
VWAVQDEEEEDVLGLQGLSSSDDDDNDEGEDEELDDEELLEEAIQRGGQDAQCECAGCYAALNTCRVPGVPGYAPSLRCHGLSYLLWHRAPCDLCHGWHGEAM